MVLEEGRRAGGRTVRRRARVCVAGAPGRRGPVPRTGLRGGTGGSPRRVRKPRPRKRGHSLTASPSTSICPSAPLDLLDRGAVLSQSRGAPPLLRGPRTGRLGGKRHGTFGGFPWGFLEAPPERPGAWRAATPGASRAARAGTPARDRRASAPRRRGSRASGHSGIGPERMHTKGRGTGRSEPDGSLRRVRGALERPARMWRVVAAARATVLPDFWRPAGGYVDRGTFCGPGCYVDLGGRSLAQIGAPWRVLRYRAAPRSGNLEDPGAWIFLHPWLNSPPEASESSRRWASRARGGADRPTWRRLARQCRQRNALDTGCTVRYTCPIQHRRQS